ncbi:MAG: glycosyltransferase family 39 protein [Bacteroidales bacterium]
MFNKNDNSLKWIYITGAIVFLLTAWFSVGYNHFDEHFQVIEFAGLKLGLTAKINLPWEYACKMRPALQPLFVCSLYKIASFAGITNPFIVAFFVRLFSALLTFFSIHMVIRLYAPEITHKKLFFTFLLLSFFLWFVPYNSVRFSSETVAGRIFLIGLAWFLLRKQLKMVDYFIAGVILGFAFITRYQVAFMILGFAAWLIIVKKSGVKNFLAFGGGVIFATCIGVVIDRWYYDEWVLTSWNYFVQNILLDKAAGFGVSPWWYYIEQTVINAFPPLSLIYILAIFLYFIYFPKDIITWTLVPFLAIHFLIPHKEIRFLFPIIGFLPVMMVKTAMFMLEKRGYNLLEKRAVKIAGRVFWYLNTIMLVMLIFRPADDQIALYKKLWDTYQTPVKLYFTGDNPYHRAKVDIQFYKRSNLVFVKTDSLQHIFPSAGTISLFVTDKPVSLSEAPQKAELVYSSFPQWVSHFNFNHWMERTSFWYVYELKNEPGR